ncbi:hypothetical protein ElyMa_002417900 [Elysia marginata]|uniref:Uncharacterized protein n=1 Tax=Elysia marginata TaxID=1093978 RepID=A0AAV4GH95_9GAST|nr:hypothetical protein ElyMa_002417900 [Elysia marginata]
MDHGVGGGNIQGTERGKGKDCRPSGSAAVEKRGSNAGCAKTIALAKTVAHCRRGGGMDGTSCLFQFLPLPLLPSALATLFVCVTSLARSLSLPAVCQYNLHDV